MIFKPKYKEPFLIFLVAAVLAIHVFIMVTVIIKNERIIEIPKCEQKKSTADTADL